MTELEMKKIWNKHDVLNSLWIVGQSVYYFNDAERGCINGACNNVETVLCYIQNKKRLCSDEFFRIFENGIQKNEREISALLKKEKMDDKKLVLGFLLRAVNETSALMRQSKV